ncbi:twin-arginine translocation signal domain-containing protein, partial [Nonomuraea fuscirosea]
MIPRRRFLQAAAATAAVTSLPALTATTALDAWREREGTITELGAS